uniref:Gamma-aminobutyric acid receptor-associated protein-like 2 n=1 Tax=Astatotilapia calliptera TaxID=8154 RepID=A0A3P8R7W6_ASTCA
MQHSWKHLFRHVNVLRDHLKCAQLQLKYSKVNQEHRCIESAKIRNKYPDRVPVIVEKVSGSQIVDIDKRKYLVPSDITVAQFMWIIRKRIQLPSEKAIFLFVDKTVPQSSITMGQLYEKEKDEDGFLYVAYSGENTFGF